MLLAPCYIHAQQTHRPPNKQLKVRLVTWVNNAPYYNKERFEEGLPVDVRGFAPTMIALNYFQLCKNISVQIVDDPKFHLKTHEELIELITEQNATSIKERLNITEDSDEDFIVLSSSTFSHTNLVNGMFQVRLLTYADGVGVLVSAEDITLVKKFFNGMSNCLGITWFSVLCAIIVASVVWAIEHLHGNSDFPESFSKGLWTSFWYCFVTMTTVGYGDKVPKHFLTRIISLFWMWFGLMLTAIITSTVMDAMNSYLPTKNKAIAVLKNSAETNYVHSKLSGIPKAYGSYEEVIDALRRKEVAAALVDINKAAELVNEPGNEDILIEHVIQLRLSVNAYVYMPQKYRNLDECNNLEKLDEVVEQHEHKVHAMYVPTYQAVPYQVRKICDMYKLSNHNYVLYVTALGCAIFISAVVSEVVSRVRDRMAFSEQHHHQQPKYFENSLEYQRIKEMEKKFQKMLIDMITEAAIEHESKRPTIKNDSYLTINKNTEM